jgi:hypothetical protein
MMPNALEEHPSVSTNEIMMIRPVSFGFNPETAASNAFQQREGTESPHAIAQQARTEFDNMVEALRREGVIVHVFEDTAEPLKPDAVFPNNWVTFHANGRIITYPMQAVSRQAEIRQDILRHAMQEWSFTHILRMDARARLNQYLEGTGSMILDRPHRKVYACLSPRTQVRMLEHWCAVTGYVPVTFRAVDAANQEIYHTNVMMALGDGYAVVCLDCIPDEGEAAKVREALVASGKQIIPIRFDQVARFAGNMLQVLDGQGRPLLVMSEQACQSLDPEQIRILEEHTRILAVPIRTIEKYGGGSARCMMAEVFRPL